jgi:hypothetical protein
MSPPSPYELKTRWLEGFEHMNGKGAEMNRDWLNAEEAVRSAFDHRWRGIPYSKWPILITDFNPMNLRVFEVIPNDWSNPLTWTVTIRAMFDRELAEIERLLATFPSELRVGVGATVTKYLDRDVHIRGFIKRPRLEGNEFADDWKVTTDICEIKARHGAIASSYLGDYDQFIAERDRKKTK